SAAGEGEAPHKVVWLSSFSVTAWGFPATCMSHSCISLMQHLGELALQASLPFVSSSRNRADSCQTMPTPPPLLGCILPKATGICGPEHCLALAEHPARSTCCW
uniref:Uncharacterized protein n=1 Tax=Athene cunicularia TaxID=194338 RepID=A0A663NCG5_ATHCN